MEDADHRRSLGFARLLPHSPAPSVVSLSPFSPIPSSSSSSRRLSSHFTPNRPVPSSRRLAWVSLQGRIVDAEEASSATAIGGGLSPEQTLAWELFAPIQRFLIVAVIGVAVAESKKNKIISQLRKSVDLRDQVLSSMQQKLDDLCEQVNSIRNHAGAQPNTSLDKNTESPPSDAFGCDKIKFIECGCWHCDYHQDLFTGLMGNSVVKVSGGDEVLQYKMPLVDEVEHDERRMSDLSDWASSVTSTADIQINMSAVDQDILNLKKECEEKDATIKELTAIIESTNTAGSKRTAELEDIIRRKNSTIAKLKKDVSVLEQKLVQLTRLRRPSSSLSKSDSRQLPLMLENIIYDMDSNTSASSSDSDSSPKNRSRIPDVKSQIQHCSNSPPCSDSNSDYSSFTQEQVTAIQIQETPIQNTNLSPRQTQKSDSTPLSDSNSDHSYFTQQQALDVQIHERTPNTDLSPRSTLKSATARGLSSSSRLNAQHAESKAASPCKEKSTIQKSGKISTLRLKQLSASGEFKKIRRKAPTSDAAPKRWM